MRLVVVSGLSGAGKSVALHTLEDLGYYCTDNLPVGLLPAFARQMVDSGADLYAQAAVVIDARNQATRLRNFPETLGRLGAIGVFYELIFLDADDDTLIKRFSETRRKHPLSLDRRPLAEAIRYERALLETLTDHADIRIDTSRTQLHQLRDLIRRRVGRAERDSMSLLMESFGFKHGVPVDADFVFDVRCLPNPYWDPHLRPYTGLDENVADFLSGDPLVEAMFVDLCNFLEAWIPRFRAENHSYLTVALGCTGGQHRSVYLADRLASHFQSELGDAVMVRHRELD